MKTYKLEDIFKFAIDLEKQGERFYKIATDYTSKKETKELFTYLSRWEAKHALTFSKFQRVYLKKKLYFLADERFELLSEVLLRGMVFPDISEVRDKLKKEENIVSIIKMAMDVETNTILFYQRFKELLKQKELEKALDKIIREEENHLLKLKNLRLDLDPLYAGLKYGKFF